MLAHAVSYSDAFPPSLLCLFGLQGPEAWPTSSISRPRLEVFWPGPQEEDDSHLRKSCSTFSVSLRREEAQDWRKTGHLLWTPAAAVSAL